MNYALYVYMHAVCMYYIMFVCIILLLACIILLFACIITLCDMYYNYVFMYYVHTAVQETGALFTQKALFVYKWQSYTP